MKRTLIVSTILILVAVFLASCMNSNFPSSDSIFELIRRSDHCELFVAAGIDALEITLSSSDVSLDDIAPLQDTLIIVRQDSDRTKIALSKFRDVDFAKPVLRISSNSADMITVSEFDSVILERDLIQFSLQEAVSPALIGDYNGDGFIKLSDFASFAPSYGFSTGSGKYDEKYDIGASQKQYSGIWQKIFSALGVPDGSIILADFAVFANNYGFANPYLGTWNFTGTIDYESSTYGYVKATGTGTLGISQQNWEMSGPVEITASSTYTDEHGNVKSEVFSIEIDSVDIEFTSIEMTITGTMANPVNGAEYDILMKGKLRVEGDAIFAESSGTGEGYGIFLINPVRKIGEWTAHK